MSAVRTWFRAALFTLTTLGALDAQAAPPAKGTPDILAQPRPAPIQPGDPDGEPVAAPAPNLPPVAVTVPPRVAAVNQPDPGDDPAFEFHEDKHYITALIMGGAVIVIPSLYYWSTKDTQSIDFTLKWDQHSWKEKLLTFDAVRFDTNRFHVNTVRHPGIGVLQYQIGRANGIGMLGSTALAFGLGAYWEYFVEYREFPSMNDIMMNTIGGMSIGEPLYQIGQIWRGGKMSFADRVRSFAFSPFDVAHDLIHEQPDWGRPRYSARAVLVAGASATRLDDGHIRHELRIRADFDTVNHGNYARSGPRSANIRPGAWSRVAGEMRFGELEGSLSRVDTAFRSQTSIAGHYSQDGQGHGVLVAVGTAFTYDRMKLAGDEWDRVGIGQLLGPQVSLTLRRPGLALRYDGAAYVTFGQIQAHAFAPHTLPFAPQSEGLYSTLQAQGYYNGWGGSLANRLRIDSGGWSFDFEAQHHRLYQINGRDRAPPGSLVNDTRTREDVLRVYVPHGAVDTRTFWRAGLDYHLGGRAWGVALSLNGSSLTGSWRDLTRETSTISAGVALTLDIDSVRGVRTPL